MSFYPKACFVVAGIAALLSPLSWFLITQQLKQSVEMTFEVISATVFVSRVDRRRMGRVELQGEHPARSVRVQTHAQIEASAVPEYTPGQRVSGRLIETQTQTYAHIGPAAQVRPWGPTPMFLGIAAFFGLLGGVLIKIGVG